MDTAERTTAVQAATYDGFISYSHAADGLLAPRLQSALQRFAKPWWRRRAIRLFRDESSLSANPHLWSSITEALDRSTWFVLLLSPDAAASPWVNQELEYWKTHRDPTRILPVVTDGHFTWDDTDITGASVPDALQEVFDEEPRWVDLRFAREEDQLDLKNPRFSAAVADIASALRGIPKDELESEEVKQHRRTIRTAWTAGVVVIALGIAATVAAVQANRQAQLALARELAASAVNVLQDDPELAILLTLEAMERTPEGIDQPVELINALWEAVQKDRLVAVIDTGSGGPVGIALSTDGTLLAAASVNDSTLRLYSVPDGTVLWSYTEETTDTFGVPFVSPNGELVAVGIWDSAGHPAKSLGERPPDDLPSRVVILDSEEGSVIDTVDYPDCVGATAQGWSTRGTYFAVSSVDACPQETVSAGGWVEILDGETFDRVALVETVDTAPFASFDESENLYVFGSEDLQGMEIYPAPEFRFTRVLDQIIGLGNISPDGSTAVTWTLGGSAGFSIADIETGLVTDLLRPTPSPPGGFYPGPRFSPDGTRVFMSTIGPNTSVWNVGTGERIFDLVGGPGTSAAMSTDGKRLYTGHTDGTVKVWNLDPAGGLQSVGDLGSFGHINSNAFSLGPELGAASAFDLSAFAGAMVFFDKATGALHGDPVAAWSPVFSAALANNLFALRNQEGVWIVYDPMTGAQTHLAGCPLDQSGQTCTDTGEPAPRIDVLASTDGTELAFSINSDPTANQLYDGAPFTLVDPDTGSEIGPLAPGRLDLDVQVFSDEWLLGWSEEGATHVAVDRITGEELARPDLPPFQRWEVSASGGTIAILEPGASALTIVDTNTWETSAVEFDLGNPRGLSFSPDERRIALGDENGLHIAGIESGVIEQSIPLPSVSDIHWFDADTVLVGGAALGGTEGMWARVPLKISDLTSHARDSLTRGFSSEECAAYRIDPCPTLEEMRDG